MFVKCDWDKSIQDSIKFKLALLLSYEKINMYDLNNIEVK